MTNKENEMVYFEGTYITKEQYDEWYEGKYSGYEFIERCCIYFESITGVEVGYEYQADNGDSHWLHFYTEDNDGLGYYIGVADESEAATMLNNMATGYLLAKNNRLS